MKSDQLDIEPAHFLLIQKILQKHVSADIKIWVFGSRASFKAKKYSDLDLALEAPKGSIVPQALINSLELDFEESDLPWKVDIIDLNDVSASFRDIIDRNKVFLDV